jgi:hypothetical protein
MGRRTSQRAGTLTIPANATGTAARRASSAVHDTSTRGGPSRYEPPQAEAQRNADADGEGAGPELRHNERRRGLAGSGPDRAHHGMIAGAVPRSEGRHDECVDRAQHEEEASGPKDDGSHLLIQGINRRAAQRVPGHDGPHDQEVQALATATVPSPLPG